MSENIGSSSDKTALIIDTNPVSRIIVEEEALMAGLTPVIAASGEEGLEFARENPPDIIIIDLLLNGRDGLEIINELRIDESTRSVPALVVTGLESRSEIDRAKKADILDLISKPFPHGHLSSILQRIFNRSDDSAKPSVILLVEDSHTIRTITKFLLEKHNHTVIEACDGVEGWEALNRHSNEVDMIITDINMPRMNGTELVEKIRADMRFRFIPVVVATTIADKETVKDLLNKGSDDYIVKPFSSEEFIARIGSHLRVKSLYRDLRKANLALNNFNATLERRVDERTAELRQSNLDAIYSLAVAAEAKDDATGNHLSRIRYFSGAISKMMGLSEAMSDEISYSSIMHDVGKISVPDSILKKPAKLTNEEFDTMKEHTIHGERILPTKPFYKTARQIARFHHEKWNGAGYPDKLSGKDIPLPARIVAVADVFDALISKRCYKASWTIEDANAEILRSAGAHFDPDVVLAWEKLYENGEIARIMEEWDFQP